MWVYGVYGQVAIEIFIMLRTENKRIIYYTTTWASVIDKIILWSYHRHIILTYMLWLWILYVLSMCGYERGFVPRFPVELLLLLTTCECNFSIRHSPYHRHNRKHTSNCNIFSFADLSYERSFFIYLNCCTFCCFRLI